MQIGASDAASYGLRVNTGGDSNGLAVMGDGKTGIGTHQPNGKLSVRETVTDTNCMVEIRTVSNGGGDPYIKFDGGGTNFIVGEKWVGTTNNYLVLGAGNDTDTTSGIFVLGDGKVGISTVAPTRPLHAVSTNSAAISTACLENTSGGDASLWFRTDSEWAIGADNSDSNSFKISNSSELGSNDRLSITTGGLVGIGKTPTTVLDIADDGSGLRLSRSTVDLRLSNNTTNGNVGTESNHDLNFRTNSANRMTITAGGRVTVKKSSNSEITALTSSSGSVAVDMNAANNFSLALAENTTLAQPTNINAGQSGAIVITQDGTGGRTMAYHAYWHFEGGTAPTLSTAGGSADTLVYYVASATSIHAVLLKDMK